MGLGVMGAIRNGIFARDRGAYDRSVSFLCDALTEDPENGRAHAELSITLAAMNRRFGAIEEANRALSYAPNDPASHLALALALLLIDDTDGAEAANERALQLDPMSVDALHLRCALALRARDADALETAATALRAALPARADPFVSLADAAILRGDAPVAEARAREALALEAESAAAHVAIGEAFYLQRRFEDARDAGLSALSIAPESAGAQKLLTDVGFSRRPVVGPLFRLTYRLETIPAARLLTYVAIGFFLYSLSFDLMRYAGLREVAQALSFVGLAFGLSLFGMQMLQHRAMARFRRQATLKRSY